MRWVMHGTTTQEASQETCPKPKERAIHDLVLLKALTVQDNSILDSTKRPVLSAEEAIVLKCSIIEDDLELFKNYPEEYFHHTKEENTIHRHKTASIEQPIRLIEPIPHEDATFLQDSANALLNQMEQIRKKDSNNLNPEDTPFFPFPLPSKTTNQYAVFTISVVHPPPKEAVIVQHPTSDTLLTNTIDVDSQSTIMS